MIEIIRNWKKKRQDRKQAKHEKLRLQATLDNQNPTGLPVGAVRSDKSIAAGYMDYLHKQKKDNKF